MTTTTASTVEHYRVMRGDGATIISEFRAVPWTARCIQRQRTRGWRLPEGAVCITRPGKWGNPFPIDPADPYGRLRAVYRYMLWLEEHSEVVAAALRELRGRDLACWCAPGLLCHGIPLLWAANA